LTRKKEKSENRKKAKHLCHGFREFKTDSKVQRRKKALPSLVDEVTAVCALNGDSYALKAVFKDMLPTNDAILLNKTKPDEFQFIVNMNTNLVSMNLLTVMLCYMDAMIIGMETDQEALYKV